MYDTKTSNKSVIGAMNQIALVAEGYENEEFDLDNLNQMDFILRMAQWINKIDGEYMFPRNDRFCIAGLNEDGQWVRPMPTDPSCFCELTLKI